MISPEAFRSIYINSSVEQRKEVLLNKGSEPVTWSGTNTGSDPKPIFSVKIPCPESQHNIWAAHKLISGSLNVHVERCVSSLKQTDPDKVNMLTT